MCVPLCVLRLERALGPASAVLLAADAFRRAHDSSGPRRASSGSAADTSVFAARAGPGYGLGCVDIQRLRVPAGPRLEQTLGPASASGRLVGDRRPGLRARDSSGLLIQRRLRH